MKSAKNSNPVKPSSLVTNAPEETSGPNQETTGTPYWQDSDSLKPIPDEILFNMIPEKIREDIKRFPRFFIGFYNRQLDGISNLHTSENTLLLEHQINTQLKLRFAESLI